jgi:chemotaxis family two-component system response regulator Rcp1
MKRNNLEPFSVLLVEDSAADVFLVKIALREEGLSCHLEVADDGEMALGVLDRVDADSECTPPQLVLLDVNLPRKGGPEVLARLRRSPRCGQIPVVMFSSSDSAEERQRALDMGASEYFSKSSTLSEFMQIGKLVRRLLEAKHETAATP